MPDYSRGKIYRLVCNETGEQYIGSTIRTLAERLSNHTREAKNEKMACKSKQIILRGDYSIVLVEEYPCENRNQLERRERHYIETMECINYNIPTRTHQEWVEVNKEKIAEQHRLYQQEKKEEIIEYKHQYDKNNKDKRNEYQRKWRANKKLKSTPPPLLP